MAGRLVEISSALLEWADRAFQLSYTPVILSERSESKDLRLPTPFGVNPMAPAKDATQSLYL
jgi:hypothetical protein